MGARVGNLRRLVDDRGQSSVEAAILLPTVLVVIAVLAQPVCVLYTRTVMASAAGDVARLLATTSLDEDDVEAYALRRLAAVPSVSIFHTGSWEVETSGSGDSGSVTVRIRGRVHPLPLLGVVVSALGEADGSEVVVEVEVTETLRASWVEGSYEDWVGVWG